MKIKYLVIAASAFFSLPSMAGVLRNFPYVNNPVTGLDPAHFSAILFQDTFAVAEIVDVVATAVTEVSAGGGAYLNVLVKNGVGGIVCSGFAVPRGSSSIPVTLPIVCPQLRPGKYVFEVNVGTVDTHGYGSARFMGGNIQSSR